MSFHFISLTFLNLLVGLLLPFLPCLPLYLLLFANFSFASRSSRLLSSDLGKKMFHRVLACRFFCSRLCWKKQLEIIYDAHYISASSVCSSSSFRFCVCYCICRNRKGHLDHVCDKKIAFCILHFAFAFDIVLLYFVIIIVAAAAVVVVVVVVMLVLTI